MVGLFEQQALTNEPQHDIHVMLLVVPSCVARTGDGCRRDEDGYFWITGRVDDVINVSGHRVGTAEVESALTTHDMCAEAAVIG